MQCTRLYLDQAKWFKKHQSQLPPRVLDYYKKNEDTAGGRALNSDLINGLVMRDGDGMYGFDLANPYVEDRRL